jgi:hypothetical protein
MILIALIFGYDQLPILAPIFINCQMVTTQTMYFRRA